MTQPTDSRVQPAAAFSNPEGHNQYTDNNDTDHDVTGLDLFKANCDDMKEFANVLTGGGSLMENGPIGGLAKLGRVAITTGLKVAGAIVGTAFKLLVRGATALASHDHRTPEQRAIVQPRMDHLEGAHVALGFSDDGKALIHQAIALCDTPAKRRKLLEAIKAAHAAEKSAPKADFGHTTMPQPIISVGTRLLRRDAAISELQHVGFSNDAIAARLFDNANFAIVHGADGRSQSGDGATPAAKKIAQSIKGIASDKATAGSGFAKSVGLFNKTKLAQASPAEVEHVHKSLELPGKDNHADRLKDVHDHIDKQIGDPNANDPRPHKVASENAKDKSDEADGSGSVEKHQAAAAANRDAAAKSTAAGEHGLAAWHNNQAQSHDRNVTALTAKAAKKA